MAPFGSLGAGIVATWIGPQWTLAIAGAMCVVQGIVFFLIIPRLRPLVLPIYIRKGILPEPGFDPANPVGATVVQ
jgi:hypothetical protein